MHSHSGGVQSPCWRGGADDPWVLVALDWNTWCCGVPGESFALVLLSMRPRWQGSLEQCVTGDEVPVHFKVVISKEYEVVDEESPRVLCV